MARFHDLDPLSYFDPVRSEKLVAVGWVETADQCDGGAVDDEFFDLLMELLADPWQPFAMAGSHRCTLCRYTGGPVEVRRGSRTARVGENNLFVPARDRVYVAPSSIVHYIDAHGYRPPEEFRAAVRGMPAMRSIGYLRLLAQHGLSAMAQRPR